MANNRYLEKDRLAHVIAAIQVLALSDRATGKLDRWIAELEASEELTAEQIDDLPIKYADRKKWAAVFEQHPEFFKSYTLHGEQRVLLRWRYSQALNADATNAPGAELATTDTPEHSHIADDDPQIVSEPLTSDQIQVLIDIAIELHAKEAAAAQQPDYVSPMLMAAIGAVAGTVVGGSAVVLLGWLQLAYAARIFD
jgi:hypothetical protein